jgi:hypothetical protein
VWSKNYRERERECVCGGGLCNGFSFSGFVMTQEDCRMVRPIRQKTLTNWLNGVESSWKVNTFSTRQEILVFCGFRRLIPAFTRGHHLSIQGQINRVCAPSHFLKIPFIIILSTPESFSGLSSSDFPIKTLYVPLLSLMSCQCHPSWFDHSNDIWWGVHSIKLPVTQLGPNMLLSTLLKALRAQHKNAESFHVLSGIRPHGLSAGRSHSYCA